MDKIKLLLSIITLTSLLTCTTKDFSNPEDVIKNFRTLSLENKNEELYDDFLSSKSKEFVTKDEFIKTRNILDSAKKSAPLLDTKISTLPIDINNPTFRRFKVEEKNLIKADTIYSRFFYTLSNENGKWKVIWTQTLLSFAYQKFDGGNYSEARKTLEKIIEIDPYSGETYSLLAWCYYRDKSIPYNEWERGFVKNAKYAVALEEDEPNHFNTLALYYSRIGNSDLAIENYERALQLCQNKTDKITFFSNLAGEYTFIGKYAIAEEYLNKSIELSNKNKQNIEDNDITFIWLKYGDLMQKQSKFTKALEYYSLALSKPKMDIALQADLFYGYAYCSKENGNCIDAKEYINKALDIEPNNDKYQSLYSSIKNCK